MKNIYFQTQGVNLQKEPFHSDGCTPEDKIDREFFHALLDEWLNSLPNLPAGPRSKDTGLLEGPSLVFGVCSEH
jgi:hypothetical protein